jgi:hypothetical protein
MSYCPRLFWIKIKPQTVEEWGFMGELELFWE